jgi:hypothetical protein
MKIYSPTISPDSLDITASFATSASVLVGSVLVGSTAEYLVANKSSQQTFTTQVGTVAITNFTSTTVDTLSVSTWDATAGTFTAGRNAVYRVGASFIVDQVSDGTGDFYALSITKNGTTIAEQIQTVYSNSNIFKPNLIIPALVQCNVGDIISFRWYQTVVANRVNTPNALQNYITIEELPTKIQK